MEDSHKNNVGDSESANIKVRVPKRVLHFSDGVLEEYSDDDLNFTPPNEENEHKPVVDPKTLPWGPWFTYKAHAAGSSALAVCDYLGETLASILGITTPKYWYEIEEYKRLEAEELKKREQAEGWSEPSAAGDIKLHAITTNQPLKPGIATSATKV